MTKIVLIIFAIWNQVLKLESSPSYQYLFILLSEIHNQIGLLFKFDEIEGKIEDFFICTYLDSKFI